MGRGAGRGPCFRNCSNPAARGYTGRMTWTLYAFLALLGIGIIALISYLVRLNRESRRLARRLDYSKMREWKDED